MTGTAGKIFEGYRLQRKLGEGWLGAVYVAHSLDDAQTQALRVLHSELVAQTNFMVQFRRLFEKWQRLNHVHVLTPYRLVEHEQHALYNMPLAASGSLRQLLLSHTREGQFIDLLVVLDMVRQVAEGISYAHQHNLIHGNLKPENLLLNPAKALLGRQTYSVVVSDFGVAELQAFTHGVHDRQIISAPAYMAPEQFKGTRTDPRSDIYSLGVVLYELLTNLLPFEAKDFAEAADKHLHVAPIPPGQIRVEIPTSVEEIVLTCMAKSPDYRYRTMQELEEALQRALNDLLPRGPQPTLILPDIPEPPAPAIEPLTDRTPYPRIQVCDRAGQLIRVEAIRDETATLGRAPSNTFVLEHAGVSRHHLSLRVQDNEVYVTDLGSTNGTTVQGLPLATRTETLWPDGSTLRIEPFWLRLQPPQRVVKQARIGVLVNDNDIELTPGQLLVLPVQLANTGKTVDHFRLEIEGVPAEWVQNLYTEVQLNPSTTTETSLRIVVPPDSRYQAQTYPMRVVARSRENPEEVGFTPMTWKVLPYYRTTSTFKPQRRSAWRKTHYELVMRNDSNVAITYRPTLEDDEGEVKLQSPWEQVNLPASGSNLRNLIPIRTIILNAYLRLREGIGKVKVTGLPEEVSLKPGEELRQRLDVRLPIRWVAAPRQRRLNFHPNPNADLNTPSSLSLQHLPLVPLWALPVLLLAGAGFAFWLLQPPKVIVSVDPSKPLPGQKFNLVFQAENTVWIEVKPLNKTTRNPKAPMLITAGVPETTRLQVIAHGRLKTTEAPVTVEVNQPLPTLNAFNVYPPSITAGQEVSVKWDIGGVKEVQLEPFGTVPAKGERKYTVKQDTVFKLNAKNNGGTLEQERRVNLLPTEIEIFDVTPPQADVGQKVKIRWRVRNGQNIQIDPFGTVAAAGQREWKVKGNQTFTLRVNGEEHPMTLNVYDPQIEQFSVTPQAAQVGDTVTLRWQTTHANKVTLSPLGTVPASGERTYRITNPNVAFNLVASNGVTTDQQQSSVTVTIPTPEIVGLSLTPAQVNPNQTVNLTWQTVNAISTELVGLPQGPLALAPSGSTSFNAPELSTPLTFTAKGADGSVASRTIELKVKPAAAPPPAAGGNAANVAGGSAASPAVPAPAAPPQPQIKRFEANRMKIQQGQSVQLRWVVTGVNQVKIFPDATILLPNSNVLLHPQTTTTYTLVAGSQQQQLTIEVTPPPTPRATATGNRPPPAPAASASGSTAAPNRNNNNAATTPAPSVPPPAAPAPAPAPAPVVARIDAFTAGKSSLTSGQSTVLHWKTTGAGQVTLTPPNQKFSADGSYTVAPRTTTTYTLQAGTQKRQVRISVVPAPSAAPSSAATSAVGSAGTGAKGRAGFQPLPVKIVKFAADQPKGLQAGAATTLRWEVQGAATARLLPQNIQVPARGSLRIAPATTTTYSLVAGSATGKVTLQVVPRPQKPAATSTQNARGTTPSAAPSSGFSSAAGTAATQAATQTKPAPQAQAAGATTTPAAPQAPQTAPTSSAVPTPTQAAASPPTPTTAESLPNRPLPKAPVIRTFSVDHTSVPKGASVTLSWEVENSNSIYITPLGRQDASGKVTRTIYRTTTFKIDARNKGLISTDEVTVRVNE